MGLEVESQGCRLRQIEALAPAPVPPSLEQRDPVEKPRAPLPATALAMFAWLRRASMLS